MAAKSIGLLASESGRGTDSLRLLDHAVVRATSCARRCRGR